MNTTLRLMLPARRLIPVVLGLCLATLATRAYQTGAAKPAAPAEQPAPTFENTKVDPHAAEAAGLWTIAKPNKPVRKIAFEDAPFDPQAAEKARLWEIDVAATRSHIKK